MSGAAISDQGVPSDLNPLSEVLNDSVMIRIVTVLNLACLSILALLEYGLTRMHISRAMAKGVIEFEKSPMPHVPETMSKRDVVQQAMETGDYYFGLLSSKVRLSRLGLYMLEAIEGEMEAARPGAVLERQEDERGTFGEQAPQLQDNS